MKSTRVAIGVLFVAALLGQAILPLVHHLEPAPTRSGCCSCPPVPALRDSSGTDHHPDSCAICKVLASVQLGEAQVLSRITFLVSSADFQPAESDLRGTGVPVQTGSPPRAPPSPVAPVQG